LIGGLRAFGANPPYELDRYGELIELTASGQLAMRRLFEEHLKPVGWISSEGA
jgi:hypothetical protein